MTQIKNFTLLFSILLTQSYFYSLSQEPVRVSADAICLVSESLPEFLTGPHAPSTEGFQIDGVVRTVFQDKSGVFWFGGQSGLQCYDGFSLNYYPIADDFGDTTTIKAIDEDSSGVLWIGHTGGLTKFDGTYFTNYTEKQGLSSNDVWNLTCDSRGNVWVATIDGLDRFDGRQFHHFALPEAPPDSTRGVTSSKKVHCILEDRKHRLWIGTNGGAYIVDGDSLGNISEDDGLCNNNVHGILEDNNGLIWFSTAHNGICSYDGATIEWFKGAPDAESSNIGAITLASNGDLWFVVRGHGIYTYDGAQIKRQDPEIVNLNRPIFEIYEDQQQRMWFVGFGGAERLDGDHIVEVTRFGPW